MWYVEVGANAMVVVLVHFADAHGYIEAPKQAGLLLNITIKEFKSGHYKKIEKMNYDQPYLSSRSRVSNPIDFILFG